ncbi:MAG: NUDIX hydrolase [Planctomycetota bacterium]
MNASPSDPSSEANTSPLDAIEIVDDRTVGSRCDEGFLRVRRLSIRNRYADGSTSDAYPCDIVSRPSADAVAIVLYRVERAEKSRRVSVVLKEAPRAPIYFRKDDDLVIPDDREYRTIVELVAGLIETEDDGPGGLERRAAIESEEEAGYTVPIERVRAVGGGTFASPGITDEKVYYCVADVTGLEAGEVAGDGSTMEEGTVPVVLELRDAIRLCREGAIPDMKTEVGLWRLADAIGYLPQLDRFADELSSESVADLDSLGVSR